MKEEHREKHYRTQEGQSQDWERKGGRMKSPTNEANNCYCSLNSWSKTKKD